MSCLFCSAIDKALSYRTTRLQEIQGYPLIAAAGVRLLVKREDLNHPTISGNKWWKLKYNLEKALETGRRTILTFGGAYSNHIYSTAAAAAELGMKSIGIIRGEKHLPLNPTLSFAIKKGMVLHYVDRTTYRNKSSEGFEAELRNRFGDFYTIPEGGSNDLAIKGCAEFAERELAIDFDHLFVACGTGGTMAGLICGLAGRGHITGVAVLKGGDFLLDSISSFVRNYSGRTHGNWSLLTAYHHGGYAKTTPALDALVREMGHRYQLPLDHVYTGKVLWAVLRQIEAGAFKRGDTILLLHTGGLQGSTQTV